MNGSHLSASNALGEMMLQIIGWLACVYLVVKGLEIVSSNAHRTTENKLHPTAAAAAVIAFVGAILFFALLNGQASASPFGSSSSLGSTIDASGDNVMNVDQNLLTPEQMNATDMNSLEVAPTDVNATY